MAAAISSHHAEWLSLVETSGPFLSVPVLTKAFPQGLDAPDRDVNARLRSAREQFDEDHALHRSWCEFVLREVLELEDALVSGPQVPAGLEHRMAEQGETLRPDLAVVDRSGGTPRAMLLVSVYEPEQRLHRRVADAVWAASPIDRIAALCRATRVPLGLVTNGQAWTLVWARAGETTGVCSWDADLWLEEQLTLRAFRTLLGSRRFFSVAQEETLPSLLEQSAQNQHEVTDRLGAQVREAVEMLIDALDRADRDRHGALLGEIANHELYRAAVTVMMRLVFLFVAEERRLLPVDDPFYAASYAASTLREQLEQRATVIGQDPLERSSAAWYRLLALFRAVHGGIDHEALRLPAYGGGLFDPDRYPFLEGRGQGSGWQQDFAQPLPVDDRTVLHLLTALQVLEEPGTRGQPRAAVRLSFRALDVEQIGHVYEGLLDHTAVRTFDAAIGLVGKVEEEVAIGELERASERGEDQLVAVLKDKTKKTENSLRKALANEPEPDRTAQLLAMCNNDPALRDRVLPFIGVIRDDLRENPRVFLPGALYVTKTLERRSSGTYYTPRSLAEEIVHHALDPVAYAPGPAEEADPAKWRLKRASELLDLKIADIAMGSGAFLVAACRYLAARVLEAWEADQVSPESAVREGATGLDGPLPADPIERDVLAHRLVAERCLYGVDKNPMAVEMAKLSLWLITLARERPFSFLDHALREGDSLLGVTSLDQVRCLHMDPARGRFLHENLLGYTKAIGPAVERALTLRGQLESFVVRDIRDAQRKAELNQQAVAALDDVRLLGNVVVGASFAHSGPNGPDSALASIEAHVADLLDHDRSETIRTVARLALHVASERWLQTGRADVTIERHCFHWPIEFPETELQGGFDAIIGNPPFLGGPRISEVLGVAYNDYLASIFPPFSKRVDLCALFFRRAFGVVRPDSGELGLLATNTISQGTTRKGGLAVIQQAGGRFHRAVPGFIWPGTASVAAAKVWIRKGKWDGAALLDDVPVAGIGSLLDPSSPTDVEPADLVARRFDCYQGKGMWGEGFYLEDEMATTMLTSDPRNGDVVRPAAGGQELNRAARLQQFRWVIDMGERDRDEARTYELPFAHLRATVRPWRVDLDPKRYSRIVNEWWKHFHPRMELYREIERRRLSRVLVRSRVSEHHMVAWLPTNIVLLDSLSVWCFDSWGWFGLIQSGIHEAWARRYGSTLETRMRYGAATCFRTFPAPPSLQNVGSIAQRYEDVRTAVGVSRKIGLTAIYNLVHDEHVVDADVAELRRHIGELDAEVLAAYGWADLDASRGFRTTDRGARYVPEGRAGQLIVERLLRLNQEEHAHEMASGVDRNAEARGRRGAVETVGAQTSMFGDG